MRISCSSDSYERNIFESSKTQAEIWKTDLEAKQKGKDAKEEQSSVQRKVEQNKQYQASTPKPNDETSMKLISLSNWLESVRSDFESVCLPESVAEQLRNLQQLLRIDNICKDDPISSCIL